MEASLIALGGAWWGKVEVDCDGLPVALHPSGDAAGQGVIVPIEWGARTVKIGKGDRIYLDGPNAPLRIIDALSSELAALVGGLRTEYWRVPVHHAHGRIGEAPPTPIERALWLMLPGRGERPATIAEASTPRSLAVANNRLPAEWATGVNSRAAKRKPTLKAPKP